MSQLAQSRRAIPSSSAGLDANSARRARHAAGLLALAEREGASHVTTDLALAGNQQTIGRPAGGLGSRISGWCDPVSHLAQRSGSAQGKYRPPACARRYVTQAPHTSTADRGEHGSRRKPPQLASAAAGMKEGAATYATIFGLLAVPACASAKCWHRSGGVELGRRDPAARPDEVSASLGSCVP